MLLDMYINKKQRKENQMQKLLDYIAIISSVILLTIVNFDIDQD